MHNFILYLVDCIHKIYNANWIRYVKFLYRKFITLIMENENSGNIYVSVLNTSNNAMTDVLIYNSVFVVLCLLPLCILISAV